LLSVSDFSILLVYVSLTLSSRSLLSFPTRRSSDLASSGVRGSTPVGTLPSSNSGTGKARRSTLPLGVSGIEPICTRFTGAMNLRSEEHTSELQSPDHLVFRLLLEKKKKNNKINKQT